MDYFDSTPSLKLEEQLHSNIANAEWVCLLLSPASEWVEKEVKKTQLLSLKLPGIILHSCTIPDLLVNDTVHIDVRMGLTNEITKSRIIETVNTA